MFNLFCFVSIRNKYTHVCVFKNSGPCFFFVFKSTAVFMTLGISVDEITDEDWADYLKNIKLRKVTTRAGTVAETEETEWQKEVRRSRAKSGEANAYYIYLRANAYYSLLCGRVLLSPSSCSSSFKLNTRHRCFVSAQNRLTPASNDIGRDAKCSTWREAWLLQQTSWRVLSFFSEL